MSDKLLTVVYSGLLGGIISEGIMGAIFMSPPIQKLLYNPDLQSALFLKITPTRELVYSISGMVMLSVIHSWLFYVFQPSVPGRTWLGKGLFWGLSIWLMYWVFQEWFIYHTLLREPILLNLLELTILLVGSLLEGCVISKIIMKNLTDDKKADL